MTPAASGSYHSDGVGVALPEISPVSVLEAPQWQEAETLKFIPRASIKSLNAAYEGRGWSYQRGQCVWGISQWINVPENLGSAYQWDDRARALGYTVSPVPKVGAVGQSDAGRYGHTVLVLDIRPGEVYVRGMNESGPYSIREYWSPMSKWEFILF